MSISGALSRALNNAMPPVFNADFDDLVAKLDDNREATEGVREITKKLDKALCVNCGPNRVKLRRWRMPLRDAQTAR